MRHTIAAAIRSPGFLIPVAIAVAAGVAFQLVRPVGSSETVNSVFRLFVLPPAIGTALLAALIGPRARHVTAAAASVGAAAVFAISVLITPAETYSTDTVAAAILQAVVGCFVVGLIVGGIAELFAVAIRRLQTG